MRAENRKLKSHTKKQISLSPHEALEAEKNYTNRSSWAFVLAAFLSRLAFFFGALEDSREVIGEKLYHGVGFVRLPRLSVGCDT